MTIPSLSVRIYREITGDYSLSSEVFFKTDQDAILDFIKDYDIEFVIQILNKIKNDNEIFIRDNPSFNGLRDRCEVRNRLYALSHCRQQNKFIEFFLSRINDQLNF